MRVRCPRCDRSMKLADDDHRVIVRCNDCGAKIDTDNDADDERPPRRRVKSKGFDLQDLTAYYRDHWLQYVPIPIFVLIGLLLLLFSVFFEKLVPIVIGLGFLITLAAFIWSCGEFVKAGHYVAWDYLEFLGGLRFFVMLLACGLYLMGYITLLLIAQVTCAIQRPRVMIPWMLMQLYGIFLMIAALVALGIGTNLRGAPRFAEDIRRQPANDVALLDQRKDQALKQDADKGPDERKEEVKEVDAGKKENKEKEKPVEKPRPAAVTGDLPLDQALHDLEFGDGPARNAALALLQKQEPKEHRDAVAKKLAVVAKNSDDSQRRLLLRPLERWATPAELPAVIEYLSDPDAYTRDVALQLLGKHKDARAVTPMIRCLVELGNLFHAEQALKEMGPVAEKEVLPLTTSKNFGVQVAAFRILIEIGTEHSVKALEAAAKGDIRTQDLAQQALRAIAVRSKK